MGRATDPLTVDQISILADTIATKPNGGLEIAIDLLGMVIHCANEKDDEYRRDLIASCTSFLRNLDWSKIRNDDGHSDYDLNVILEFVLAASTSENEIGEILHNLMAHENSQQRYYSPGLGRFLPPFFEHHPRQALDAIYLADDDGSYRTATRIVSNEDSDLRETAIRKIPTDVLIEWCEISPKDRYVFAAETCGLFDKKPSVDSKAAGELTVSETARRVLANARDKKEILQILVGRFRPSGWSGSLSQILAKRLPLLQELNPNGDSELEAEIAPARVRLKEWIAAEEAREEAEERGRTASFE